MRTINITGSATIAKQPECFNVTVNVNSKLQDTIAKANEIVDIAIQALNYSVLKCQDSLIT